MRCPKPKYGYSGHKSWVNCQIYWLKRFQPILTMIFSSKFHLKTVLSQGQFDFYLPLGSEYLYDKGGMDITIILIQLPRFIFVQMPHVGMIKYRHLLEQNKLINKDPMHFKWIWFALTYPIFLSLMFGCGKFDLVFSIKCLSDGKTWTLKPFTNKNCVYECQAQ